MPANVLPSLCILLLRWDDSLTIRVQPLQFHLSATLASVIRAALRPKGPVSRASALSASLSLPVTLPPHSLAHPLSLRQQLRTGDTGVPATRGSQSAVPQKADMPRLRGVGAMGGDRQPRGHPDRAGAEHMQQFSSTAPTHTFPEHLLDLQRRQDGLVGE
ncbi:hypothetical protein GBF38_017300 [Nibea albiflora]|uniref:Uncharacterized protein n=1 Tax=Nibea albiflora TaxID=240163 RepID=A0ACB7FJL5_NIBAL|nr:hypothetical protein GBF38_017300 [Nibea albiflora]